MLKFFKGHARKPVSAAVLLALGAGIATMAVLYPGYTTADVKLNDGGVWVTRSVDAMVGHLNYPSRTLDGAVHTCMASTGSRPPGPQSARSSSGSTTS